MHLCISFLLLWLPQLAFTQNGYVRELYWNSYSQSITHCFPLEVINNAEPTFRSNHCSAWKFGNQSVIHNPFNFSKTFSYFSKASYWRCKDDIKNIETFFGDYREVTSHRACLPYRWSSPYL
uniref:Uncharacterized protein n=1 Tax=Rhizophora mucronata TaxID=61149 RepID=A0A2P2K292_RHIMU